MIKTRQKPVSLWVVLVFLWMSHVSALPLTEENGAAQAVPTNSEQGPGFVETMSQEPAPSVKKNVLPYILIGAGVAVMAVILFLAVFKAKYDVAGYWTGIETFYGKSNFLWYKFSGDKKSGWLKQSTRPLFPLFPPPHIMWMVKRSLGRLIFVHIPEPSTLQRQ